MPNLENLDLLTVSKIVPWAHNNTIYNNSFGSDLLNFDIGQEK
jgi:hypothetical protein